MFVHKKNIQQYSSLSCQYLPIYLSITLIVKWLDYACEILLSNGICELTFILLLFRFFLTCFTLFHVHFKQYYYHCSKHIDRKHTCLLNHVRSVFSFGQSLFWPQTPPCVTVPLNVPGHTNSTQLGWRPRGWGALSAALQRATLGVSDISFLASLRWGVGLTTGCNMKAWEMLCQ